MPQANTIDQDSPLGVSVFARVAEQNGLLHQADKQYSRILWEFEGSELAVHADVDMFKKDNQGNPLMPEGKERLYRKLDIDATSTNTKQIDTFSPEIRDSALFNGLNKLLRQIEWQVGFAYGVLSDIQDTDKTATEVKASKMRSYQTVKDIQNNLQVALENLVYSLWYVGTIGELPIKPVNLETEISFNFDDSIITDKTEDLNRLFLATTSGILKPEFYLAELYGISKEEVLKRDMIPKDTIIKPDPFQSSQE
jgi:A118 family predicted phage portal protein